MGQGRAAVSTHGLVGEAETLWYDLSRRATFVDGFKAVVRVSDAWPAGGELLWDSHPGGRGRVSERVLEHAAREGQTARVEDETISGTQTVAFASSGHETIHVSLALDYELKNRRLVVADWLFIRRAQRDSLRRTLDRFVIELAGDREL